MPRFDSLADRFWSKAIPEPTSGCLLWLAGCDSSGYGTFANESRVVEGAHRASYRLTNGAIPRGLRVLHKCDVPCCVNPGHLFLGTQRDNIHDMFRKGRNRPTSRRGNDCHQAKLTDDAVREIRRRYAEGGITHKKLASEYGVFFTVIQKVVTGKIWRHVK